MAPFAFLRFLAAWIVIFFHFGQKTHWYEELPTVFRAGPQMVTFFFVLSGFMLYLGYQQRETLVLRHYFFKRVVRILPLYLLALAGSAILGGSRGKWSWGELAVNILGVQSWFSHPTALNFTSWFVSNLLFFYAIFPLIFFLLQRHRPGSALFFSGCAGLWGVTQGILIWLLNSGFYQGFPSFSHDLLFYLPLPHLCSFLLGVSGAYWVGESRPFFQQQWMHSSLLTLLLLVVVGLLIQWEPVVVRMAGGALPFQISFYAPIFLALILHIALSTNGLLALLSLPVFLLAGEISYGLYILQSPLDLLYHRLLPPSFVVQPEANFFIFSGFLLVLVILLSWLEQRGMKRLLAIETMQRMAQG